jgi:hypothetical protein
MTTTEFTATKSTATEFAVAKSAAPGSAAAGSTAPGSTAPGRENPLATLRPLLIDVAVPLGSLYLLRGLGVGLVTSLAVSSILPALRTVAGVVKDRTVNGLAALIIAVNVVSIAISFWSGDPRAMLAKDGVVTSTIGIAILISAFRGRPLMTAGMRPFLVKGSAAKDAAFGRLLATSPRFRQLERRFSLVWGIALIADCVARVCGAFTLPVGTMMWLSTVFIVVAIAAGILVGSVFSVPMETMVKAEAAE